jgi:molybdopterin-guanine dinucleotide biosynthesis protein A
MNTIGVVLAGGLSRRYGSPKAFATMKGNPYYEIAYEALSTVSDVVVLVARSEFLGEFHQGLNVIVDVKEFMGCGPLAGIYSVMAHFPADRYVILPCDMPYISSDVIDSLVAAYEDDDVLAVEVEGIHHPIVAIYHHRMKDSIHYALEHGQYSVMKWLNGAAVRWVEGNELTMNAQDIFRNMNTPGEY